MKIRIIALKKYTLLLRFLIGQIMKINPIVPRLSKAGLSWQVSWPCLVSRSQQLLVQFILHTGSLPDSLSNLTREVTGTEALVTGKDRSCWF